MTRTIVKIGHYGTIFLSAVTFVTAALIFSRNWQGAKAIYLESPVSGSGPVNELYGPLFGCILLTLVTLAVNFVKIPQRFISAAAIVALMIVALILLLVDGHTKFLTSPGPPVSPTAKEALVSQLQPLLRVFSFFVLALICTHIAMLTLSRRIPSASNG